MTKHLKVEKMVKSKYWLRPTAEVIKNEKNKEELKKYVKPIEAQIDDIQAYIDEDTKYKEIWLILLEAANRSKKNLQEEIAKH